MVTSISNMLKPNIDSNITYFSNKDMQLRNLMPCEKGMVCCLIALRKFAKYLYVFIYMNNWMHI